MFYRYIPAVEESAISIVTERHSENFVVAPLPPLCSALRVPLAATGPTCRYAVVGSCALHGLAYSCTAAGANFQTVPSTATVWTCRHVLHFALPLVCIVCCLCSALGELSNTKAQTAGVLWRGAVLRMVLCLNIAASALRQKRRRALPPAALG